MFDSIGWGEILVLFLAALFIFGPERLPDMAKEAAAGMRKVRTALTGVRQQVNDSFGDDLPELRDLDLRKYHPKTFIRSQLFDEEPETPPVRRRGSTASSAAASAAAGATAASSVSTKARPRDRSTPPPFDLDAT